MLPLVGSVWPVCTLTGLPTVDKVPSDCVKRITCAVIMAPWPGWSGTEVMFSPYVIESQVGVLSPHVPVIGQYRVIRPVAPLLWATVPAVMKCKLFWIAGSPGTQFAAPIDQFEACASSAEIAMSVKNAMIAARMRPSLIWMNLRKGEGQIAIGYRWASSITLLSAHQLYKRRCDIGIGLAGDGRFIDNAIIWKRRARPRSERRRRKRH